MPDAEGNAWTADSVQNITKDEYHAMSEDEYDGLGEDVIKVLANKAKEGNWDEFESAMEVE